MNSKIEERRDLAWAAFRAFDLDGNGMISKCELEHVLEDHELQRLFTELQDESTKLQDMLDHEGHPVSPGSPTSKGGMIGKQFGNALSVRSAKSEGATWPLSPTLR